MSMRNMGRRYSVHLGQGWPPEVGRYQTRGQAREAAKRALHAYPWDSHQGLAIVRNAFLMVDRYVMRPSGSIRHAYSYQQRVRERAEL